MMEKSYLGRRIFVLGLILLWAACAAPPEPLDVGLGSFSGERLMSHIETLASDEFEGRAPGSRGEELTLDYLQGQFQELGLVPGNPDGTYLQRVPLVGVTSEITEGLALSRAGRTLRPNLAKEYVAVSRRLVETVSVDAEMVFAGYGVQAPEFNWDDFKDVDVRDRVIVVLINDPPVPDGDIFGGPAMTYYGRWTYKYEKAAEMGAAGVFIVHETGPAGYPWAVVEGGWTGEQFDLQSPDLHMDKVPVQGWIASEQAEALFDLAGLDFNELKSAAVTREFRPVELGVRARLGLRNTMRNVESHNVIAKLSGGDVRLSEEYVLYCAHWDHLGMTKDGEIFNGAKDNASGVAALLEIARAFQLLPEPPARSILFLAVTAEEQGLLGSRYYAENPLYPLNRTAAAINLDSMNVWGPTRDLAIIGMGNSTLDEVAAGVAAQLDRTLRPDPEPEKGFFYRSDHFSFAKQGVPAFYSDPGIDFPGRPEGWGLEMRAKYIAEDYHKPSDTIKDFWDLSGLAEDAKFLFLLGYRVAENPAMPEWKPGTEFKAIREASLRGEL